MFKTPYNAQPDPGEINTQASVTVPDDTMSIREIMARHARGLPTTGVMIPIYNGEDDDLIPPNFHTLDISEKMELAELNRQRLEDIKRKLNEKAALQQKQRKKAFEDQQRASQPQPSQPPPLSNANTNANAGS